MKNNATMARWKWILGGIMLTIFVIALAINRKHPRTVTMRVDSKFPQSAGKALPPQQNNSPQSTIATTDIENTDGEASHRSEESQSNRKVRDKHTSLDGLKPTTGNKAKTNERTILIGSSEIFRLNVESVAQKQDVYIQVKIAPFNVTSETPNMVIRFFANCTRTPIALNVESSCYINSIAGPREKPEISKVDISETIKKISHPSRMDLIIFLDPKRSGQIGPAGIVVQDINIIAG